VEIRKLQLPGDRISARNDTNGDGWTISGLAAVFYNGREETEFVMQRRRDGRPSLVERIMPGAFDRTLKDRPDVLLLFNHNSDLPLARSPRTLRLWTDRRGLHYRFDAPDSPNGDNVVEAVRRGDVSGASFGFTVIDEIVRMENELTIRELHEIALTEISLTSFPAYKKTSAQLGVEGRRSSMEILRARLDLDLLEMEDLR